MGHHRLFLAQEALRCAHKLRGKVYGRGEAVDDFHGVQAHLLKKDGAHGEKWDVFLGIRLLGTSCWSGLSNHRAANAQMGTVDLVDLLNNKIRDGEGTVD